MSETKQRAERTRPADPRIDSEMAPPASRRDADPAKPPSPASDTNWRWGRVALLVALFAVLAGSGWWVWGWWTHGRFIESTNDAYLQADQVPVSARVSGLVQQVEIKDHQAVEAGQLLVQIDDRDPRARLEVAHAQIDQGRAGIAQAEAQINQQRAQIEQAQAALEGAQSQLAFAEKEAARYARLAGTGAETGQSYDQKRQNRDQARAQVAQNKASLLSAQRQIGTLQAQIRQSQAQIEQAQAQGRQAQVDLDATSVRARIAGRIGDKSVQAGQYVQTGTRMMSVVPVKDLYIVANFKETQMRNLRVGQPATIDVDALGSQALHGYVESFAPGTGSEFALLPPNNATGNFTKIVQRVSVRVHIDPDAGVSAILVPGLSATVAVDTIGAADPKRARDRDRMAAAGRTP